MAEMNFEQIKERLDYFERTFKNATKSLKEFIKELEGGDSSRFEAWVEQLSKMQDVAIDAKKEIEKLNTELDDIENTMKEITKLSKAAGETEAQLEKRLQRHFEHRKLILNQLNEHKKRLNLIINDQNKLNNLVISTIKSTDKFLERLKLKNYNESLFYKMMKSFRDGGKDTERLSTALKSMGGRVKDMIEPLNLTSNIFFTIIRSTVSMVNSLSETLSSFQKNTGIVGVYNDVIFDAYQNNLEYSVSLEKVREATEQLNKDMESFSLMSMENRQELIEMISLYDKFGASTHELTEFFGKMTDTFKMSVGGTKELMEELRGLHNNIGGPWRKIIDNFNDHLGRLARFGIEGAKKAFKELSVISRSLRIEFDDLFKVTDQFDTYESAAQIVSRFNAIAGGPYLNTISLMKQSDDERAKSLIQAIRQSRINYDLLSAQEKQALATSIGITDMTVAQKIFTGSLSDYYKLRSITNETEEQAKDKAQKMASIQDKLNTIFESFAVIIEPILWVLSGFLSIVRDIVMFFTKGWQGALHTIIALLAFFTIRTVMATGATAALGVDLAFAGISGTAAAAGTTAAAAGVGAVGAASTATAPKLGFLGKMLTGMLTILGTAGNAAWAAIPGIIGLGIAVAIVAAVVWLLAKALKAIADIFSDDPMSAEQAAIVERMSRIPAGSDKKINDLSSALENLSDSVSDLNYDGLKNMLDLLDEIAEKTKNLTSSATISITRNIADMFEAAGKITTANTTEIRNVVSEIVRVGSETDAAKIEAAKEFAMSANKNINTQTNSGQPVINVIELNGREMARWFSQQLETFKFDITKQKQK